MKTGCEEDFLGNMPSLELDVLVDTIELGQTSTGESTVGAEFGVGTVGGAIWDNETTPYDPF